jgi:hypothetical protein
VEIAGWKTRLKADRIAEIIFDQFPFLRVYWGEIVV